MKVKVSSHALERSNDQQTVRILALPAPKANTKHSAVNHEGQSWPKC